MIFYQLLFLWIIIKGDMESFSEFSKSRLESKSSISAYFERAGALGHIVVMVAFYIIVFTGLIILL